MEKPVLVLDYSVDARSGDNISRWFSVSSRVERVSAGDPFPVLRPSDHRAVVHSGSALSIMDDHPFIAGASDFIRGCCSAGVPQMGICYGHQLLARVMSGIDSVERCSSVELGWIPVEFLPSWPVRGLSGSLAVWQSHYDRVKKLPEGSVITATDSHTEIQAFFNGELRLFGTQFHPEFDRDSGNRCFSEDPDIFTINGIDLERTLQGGPGFNTGEVVFDHFLRAFEQEL